MNKWQTILKSICQRYGIVLIAAALSFFVTFGVITAFLSRNYAVGMLKNQFEELEKNLQSIGYDYAYDDLQFYSFSPWQIMRAKNFKIYSLDDKDFWQWTVEDLNIDVGLWDNGSVDVFLGSRQSIQRDKKQWMIYVPKIDTHIRLKNGSFKEFSLSTTDVYIKNLMSLDSLMMQIKHQKAPYITVKADAKGIVIDDITGWPLNKKVDHLYLDMYQQGIWDKDILFSEAFYDWADKGGRLVVQKGILNWKPLIMVANGNIAFNEKADATVSLNTASLGLSETVEKLHDNGFISNKGAFVVKILLNNKEAQQSVSDKYKMVVSPLKFTKDGIFLENIKIK